MVMHIYIMKIEICKIKTINGLFLHEVCGVSMSQSVILLDVFTFYVVYYVKFLIYQNETQNID